MSLLTPHQQSALDYKNHISLTANAGSGKTFVLSRRYLEIALNENISLRNIAAITFTDKAASELYKKIANHIDENISETSNINEIKKLENIRRQLVSANISTIHSFCIDILREHPVEAALDANFIPIDEQISSELIELSTEEVIKKSLKNPEDSDKLKYLIRILQSKISLEGELTSLIKNRKNVLSLASDLYSKSEEKIADYFSRTFADLVKQIFFADLPELKKNIELINDTVLLDKPDNDFARKISALIPELSEDGDIVKKVKILSSLKNEMCTAKNIVKNKGYLTTKLRDNLSYAIDYLDNYWADFARISFPENHGEVERELARFGKTLIYFFQKTLLLYTEKKNESGYLDYEDILLHAQRILTNEDVKKSISEKYKYIMVDEYQDTNELQYQIFLPILDFLKKGNLFVVGDEKQSIYMFRDAELEVFDKTKNAIAETSGSNYLLSLPDSFRMSPAICVFTNTLFGKLFNNPNKLYNEVNQNDLVYARNDDIEGGVEILIAGTGEEENGEHDEAELVAERIINLVREGSNQININWGDIAILCRKRKSFAELEQVFVEKKIPFVIVGGKGFYQRQAVYDIFNYFSFLLDTDNDTALTGILRSPFFNITDAGIFRLSLQPGKTYWRKLRNLARDEVSFAAIADTLNKNIISVSRKKFSSVLRDILNQSGYWAVLASKANGRQELANIDKLLKLTIAFGSQGFGTLYDYVNFLKSSIEQIEDEAQAAVSDESNSVKIMTIHQSKGLEYPAVFLYKCDEQSRSDSVKSRSVSVNKKFGLLTKVPVNGNFFAEYETAPLIGISNLISYKKNIAELKRLFYVGVTRAKDFLFLSASYKKDFNYGPDTFMGLLRDGLNIDFIKDEYKITAGLEYLTKADDKYENVTKTITVNIPIIKKIEKNEPADYTEQKISIKKNIRSSEIEDIPEGEIVSATKVAVYKQCPLKYQLTYDYGFTRLFSKYKKWKRKGSVFNTQFEFNIEEDKNLAKAEEQYADSKIKSYADVKGRIVHKILEKEFLPSQVEAFVKASVKNELDITEYSDKLADKLTTEITSNVNHFFGSKIYGELKRFANFYNEYEIYVKEEDFYLYGIIDKLIIDNNKVIIIDYKTDDINEEEIEERGANYLTQLKFYSYIVSHLFENISNFELRLIFVKYPDHFVAETLSFDDLKIVKKEILGMVKNMRNMNYSKNLEHCRNCLFALNYNNCIVG